MKNINLFYTFLFILAIAFIITACTNPIELGDKTQTGSPTVVYSVDNSTSIQNITASPVNNDLAVISKKNEFDIIQFTDSSMHIHKKNVYDICMGASPRLAPGGDKIFVYQNQELTIFSILDSSRQIFKFTTGLTGKIKWTNSDQYLTSWLFSVTDQTHFVYQTNLITNKNTLLYTDSHRNILAVDHCPYNNLLCFYGNTKSAATKKFVFLYNLHSMTLDSMQADQQINNISISNDGSKILLLKNINNNITNLKIIDLVTRSTIDDFNVNQLLHTPYWDSEDKNILFSISSGYALYSVNNAEYKKVSISQRSECALHDLVWGENKGQILCLRESPSMRLSIYNTDSGTEAFFERTSNQSIISPAWSPDGKELAYISGKNVILLTPGQNTRREVEIPFSFIPVLRWGPETPWLSFVTENDDGSHLKLYNHQTGDVQEYKIPLAYKISDFSWVPETSIFSLVFPEIQSMYFYQFDGSSINRTGGITADILNLHWASNRDLINSIGNYALIQGKSTLGIFFKNRNTINWLQHFDVQKAAKYSWSSDGQSLYYSGAEAPYDKQIYLEQVIFIKD